jgi:hypothetical protein
MKKKLLALLAIVAFVAAPTFANTASDKFSDLKTDASIKVSETNEKIFSNTSHPTWAAGLVLGTNSGVQINYRANPQLTIEGVVGFGILNKNLMLEAYGMYNVSRFEISEATFDFNAGVGANLGLSFDATTVISTSFVGAGEIVYSFDDNLPLDLALRVGMGVNLVFVSGGVTTSLTVPAGITCTYRFI